MRLRNRNAVTFPFSFAAVSPIFSASKIMADDKKHTYGESKVKTLSSIEHIRLRTDWRCGSCGKLVENEN